MSALDKVITCENKDLLPLMTLLASCFGKDADGNVYLRTTVVDACGDTPAIDCANNNLTEAEQVEQLLRTSIVLNCEGKPSLAIGQCNCI
jgi:outer membrane protein assembly factor BamB